MGVGSGWGWEGDPPALPRAAVVSSHPPTPSPTDPFLVVDAPLVVLAHHHLDAPLPVIALQDDGLGRVGEGLSERPAPSPPLTQSPPGPAPPAPRSEGLKKGRGREACRLRVPGLCYLWFPVLISLRPLQGGHEATDGALPPLHI